MAFKTPLSGPPYFDRFASKNKYYHVAFKPGLSVQTGELNEVESILRNQIEKFGDSIFQNGTVIKGCNFIFYDNYPYVKLSDTLVNGQAAGTTAAYFGLTAENSNGLTAFVTNYIDGFEGSNVQKTIYLTYTNSGDDFSTDSFSPGDTLTIYNPSRPIFKIIPDNGSFNFSKSDKLIAVSALQVNVTSGTFTNGDYLIQPTSGANVQIIGITPVNGTNNVILNIKPRDSDLANAQSTISNWSFEILDDVKNSSNSAIGSIQYIYGAGVEGEISVTSTGKVIDVIVTNGGKGYEILPWVGIQSANNLSGIGSLALSPQNFYAEVKVLSQANAVGNGYAFGVTSGIVYQRGLFLDVDEQTIVVENYNNQPNNVSVGFDTEEAIVTYLQDPTLYDNAFTENNKLAPGADRVMVNPVLTVVSTDAALANNDFFSLVQWNDGKPFNQHQDTAYSVIGDEMARRTSETNGDFVLDPFLCTTDAVSNTSLDSQYYTAIIDPGTAYISGYRVKTLSNYRLDVSKGLDTKVANSQKISLNLGSYIRISEVGGVFQFSTGDNIDLYDTAKTFLSNTSLALASNTTPQGTKIGTARIRSMMLESGLPGDSSAIYRLYLFAVNLNSGANFRNIKSVYYNGTFKGIADVVLQKDATTNSNIAVLQSPQDSSLLFKTGLESIKNTNNAIYNYRSIDQTANFSNSGILTKSIASSPNEFFPYSGSLTSGQLSDLYVIPLANNLIQYSPLTGTISINTTSANAVGSGTAAVTDVRAGDYLYIYSNTSQFTIKKVISVANDTQIILDSNCSFANATCNYKRVFPKNIPIPFGSRSGLSANVNSNGNILMLNLGFTIDSATSVNTAIAYNVQRTNVTSASKIVNRHGLVKIYVANNAGGNTGPWCLGVSDAFRLRNVYVGNSSVSNTSPNVVDEFYLETNHTTDFKDLSYLTLDPKSSLVPSPNDYYLVEFDYYTSLDAGYHDTVSYLHTSNSAQIAQLDSTPLGALDTAACSWEVPEIYKNDGTYYDLINCIDFRPAVSNTVTIGSNSSNAPINPPYVLSFGNTADPTNDKKFPIPNSLATMDVEIYMGRLDDIIIGHDGVISCIKGIPSQDVNKRSEPNIPSRCLKLQTINVPAYPNITKNINKQIVDIISTRAVNENNSQGRLSAHLISPLLNANNSALAQPMRYTEAALHGLERRIATLEYYERLSLLQSDVTKRVIPSSIDSSQNRFKYGFFVDDFADYKYSERTNPQYSAAIETVDGDLTLDSNNLPKLSTNLLVPSKLIWPLPHVIQQAMPQAHNYTIVNQNTATDGPPPCNLISTTVSTNTTATDFATSFVYWDSYWGKMTEAQSNKSYAVGNVSANIDLYYFFPNDPFITIYQGNSTVQNTVIQTSMAAYAITQAELTVFNANVITKTFWDAVQSKLYFHPAKNGILTFSKNAKGFVVYGGHMSWAHDPSKGNSYRVRVTDVIHGDAVGAINVFFQYMITYPVNPTAKSNYVVEACQGTSPTVFNGVMHANTTTNPSTTVATIVNTTDANGALGASVLNIRVTGLKPLTKHQFYVDGVLQSNTVRQASKNYGEDIITDDSGSCDISYIIPASWASRVVSQQINFQTPLPGYKSKITYSAEFDQQTVGTSYSLFEIKATNSLAFAYVPIASPNKISF